MTKTIRKPSMHHISQWNLPDIIDRKLVEQFAEMVMCEIEHEVVCGTKLPADKQQQIYNRIKQRAKRIQKQSKEKHKIRKYDRAMEVVRGEKKDTGE